MLLLTGATGRTGSYIAREFIDHGVPVRFLVRDRLKADWYRGIPTIEVVGGDMAEPSSLVQALSGVTRVLMVSSPALDMARTQIRFIDACRSAGVRHLIKLSGLNAGRETTFLFSNMHKQVEEHLRASGMAWTSLRPTGFMQEYINEAPSVVNDDSLYLALDDVKLNPVDLLDVGKVGFRLLRDGGHEGETLPMTGPELLGMADIAQHLSAATGRKIRYVPVSPLERWRALVAAGVPTEVADALDKQVHERLQRGAESTIDLSTHHRFDVTPTPFSEFAKRHSVDFGAAQ
jgi:uncharacterized protein YbjT (DUF2867 family)